MARKYQSKRKSFSMVLDTQLIDEQLNKLGTVALAATRKAAHSGAEVFYKEVLLNVDRYVGMKTGNLRSSIYQAFSEEKSRVAPGVQFNNLQAYEKAVYHVSWNYKKAPHGHLVEYGHVFPYKVYQGSDGNWYTAKNVPSGKTQKEATRPFLRPAWDAKRLEATEAMRVRWITEVKKALE